MKKISKRSDARSYSPLSFLETSHPMKVFNRDILGSKHGQSDATVPSNHKIISPFEYSGSMLSYNYLHNRKKRVPPNLNQTLSHNNEDQKDSSFEEHPTNYSCHDGGNTRNKLSQNSDVLRKNVKARANQSIYTFNENIPPSRDVKHTVTYKTSASPLNYTPQWIENILHNRRDRALVQREEQSYMNNVPLRRHTKNGSVPCANLRQTRDESRLFPKINPLQNTKTREEIKTDKMLLIERTYSLSPYKMKSTKQSSSSLIETKTEDKKATKTCLNKAKLNKTQDQFCKTKSPSEVTRKGITAKGIRGRSQAISRTSTPKTQLHSPTDQSINQKQFSSTIMRKDESWGTSSIKTNPSQFKIGSQIVCETSKESLVSSKQNQGRQLSEKSTLQSSTRRINGDSMTKEENSGSNQTLECSNNNVNNRSKQKSDGLSQEFSVLNQSDSTTEKDYVILKPKPRRRKYPKTQIEFKQRMNTTSNNSAKNVLDIGTSSRRQLSYGGRLSTKENEDEQQSTHELRPFPFKKKQYKSQKEEVRQIERQESNENVLDEFADKSIQVSVQDQNQSFAQSSTTRTHFDDLLGNSLLCYLNENASGADPTRKDIETGLSLHRPPIFKRTKVVVTKGLTSIDKDHMNVTTTTNSKSTNKNESLQFKGLKDEVFQSEPKNDKSKGLEIDFNFGEDIKAFQTNQNINNQVSPSFPRYVPTNRSNFAQIQGLPQGEIEKIQSISRGRLDDRKGISVRNSDAFEVVSVSQDDGGKNEEQRQECESPTANQGVKPIFFYANNKLNKYADMEKLEQSFNENPMNSFTNFSQDLNTKIKGVSYVEKELSFKSSLDIGV